MQIVKIFGNFLSFLNSHQGAKAYVVFFSCILHKSVINLGWGTEYSASKTFNVIKSSKDY